MMKDLNIKQLIIVILVGSVVIITIGIYIYKMANQDEISYDMEELGLENEVVDTVEEIDNSDNEILVHVTGCVNDKGIVVLKEGDRIIDAIEAAGGETEEADLNKLNLAYVLQDGDKLYVPSITDNEENVEYISEESGNNVIEEGVGKTMEKNNAIININTASKEELVTLDGIGEATAEKILAYRQENGKFKTIEDIKNVPGIGDAKFEKIKNQITVS